jgi:uncharacterized protein YukE
MTAEKCITLDTKAFDAVKDLKDGIVADYDKINADYDKIIRVLLAGWEGKGADAFREDAAKVKTNIGGIYDILKTMCDTLDDCRKVFAEADSGNGEFCRSPFSE